MQRRAFSVGIYAVHDDAVLLVHHKRLAKWLPVGGECEANETPLEAARRELFEETGLEGDFGLPAAHGVDGTPGALLAYEEHEAGSKGLHLNFNFACRVPSRAVRSDGSFSDARWVGAKDLDALGMPANVRACARLALEATKARKA
ncbi:MAG TPA: NUDIX domain-containing protein [Candidatus Thermoplasmatota archaeon]|nr:NUDIX domain-containing protein [Candidatus Thermoplasmatota archaeon]